MYYMRTINCLRFLSFTIRIDTQLKKPKKIFRLARTHVFVYNASVINNESRNEESKHFALALFVYAKCA